ncbi:alginate lyase family protein [Litchfieldella xinjiangensis]|uniref:alginate lyase family protein n=1 Tax=Litchfieldella xinjiangensis TaxID=1166948 RepID=UPI000693F76C|nr:alginate lyase family protein [Halomonas xinjiangensis]
MESTQPTYGVFKGVTTSLLSTLVLAVPPAGAMTIAERNALDLSDYTVQVPDASYFDVEKRMEMLGTTTNSLLLQQRDTLSLGPSCKQLLDLPPLTSQQRIPGYYPARDDWEMATEPMFEFEESVSTLAGSYVATGDDYYAECLVQFLDHWATESALINFHYEAGEPQAWFNSASMIFSAAMAYSTVRPAIEGMQAEQERVEDWLNGLAHFHVAIPGGEGNSCCNNHFYRRALYASMVGVLTQDDELFQIGVSGVYSALHDLTAEGALPLEVKRGRRAVQYQNYALLYLLPNMEIIARQGYDIYDLDIEGSTIHDAVDFALDIMADPTLLDELAPREQSIDFIKEKQFFSWMEIYRSRFQEPRIDTFLANLRPVYNRSAGGFTTLYFMDPELQQHVRMDDERQEKMAFEGLTSEG